MNIRTLLIVFISGLSAPAIAQDSTILDHTTPWTALDTTRYSTIGYIAASYSIIDGLDISNKNYGICISGGMPIKKTNFGIAAKLGFSSAPLVWATTRFNEYYALAGPYFTYQITTRYSFDVRALFGATYCIYPEQDFSQTNDYINTYGNTTADSTVYSQVSIEAEKALIFLLQAGIGFKYIITHKIGVMLNVDYMKRYSLNVTQNTKNISTTIDYSYNNGTISSKNYDFPPNNTSTAYFGNNDPFGFTVFSLGICFQIGEAELKK